MSSELKVVASNKGGGKVKDEGGKGDNAGNRPEGSSEIIVGCGDQVGGGRDRFHDGSIDQHLWCLGVGAAVEGFTRREGIKKIR